MARYVSRPQTVEAVRWTGNNWEEVRSELPQLVLLGPHDAQDARGEWQRATRLMLKAGKDGAQGWVPVPVGHWLVHAPGDLSDVWPVEPDYFAAKYDEAPPPPGAGTIPDPYRTPDTPMPRLHHD